MSYAISNSLTNYFWNQNFQNTKNRTKKLEKNSWKFVYILAMHRRASFNLTIFFLDKIFKMQKIKPLENNSWKFVYILAKHRRPPFNLTNFVNSKQKIAIWRKKLNFRNLTIFLVKIRWSLCKFKTNRAIWRKKFHF